MNQQQRTPEGVVRRHLQAFRDQEGAAAILADYHDDARLITEEAVYRGKEEILAFFEAFLGSIPAKAIPRFSLRTLKVDGSVAYITWSLGGVVDLGTDTFLVDGGKIRVQTVALQAAAR